MEAGVVEVSRDKNDLAATLPVREWLLLAFMAFATLGLYYPALLAPYCYLDDWIIESVVLNNPTWSFIRQLFGTGEDAFGVGVYFRPLSDLVYFLIGKVVGMEPAPFHLFNVLIHLANGFLVYSVIKRIYTSSLPAAIWVGFIGAMLFLVHPVNVEAVAWISGRSSVLSTFFILLAFFFYVGSKGGLKDWHPWAAALCYLLSLLSYELTTFMPLAFIAWDLGRDHNGTWRESVKACYPRWVIWGVALAIYVLYRLAKGASVTTSAEAPGGDVLVKFLDAFLAGFSNPFVAIGLYLKKMFWPWPLNLYLDGASAVARPVYLAVGATFPVVVAWLFLRRAWPWFWGIWFLSGLLSVLTLTFVGFSWTGTAERYVYLSTIAFAAFVAIGTHKVMAAQPRWRGRMIEAVTLVILFLFGASSTMRTVVWQSNVALMKDTWEKNPTSGRVATIYGGALRLSGRTEEAVAMWRKAIELGIVSAASRCLGDVEREEKNYAAAERYYLQALWPIGKLSGGVKPVGEMGINHKRDPSIYLALVDLHYKMAEQNPERSEYHHKRILHFHEAACKVEPGDPHLRYLLAKAHLHLGDRERARTLFTQVSEMVPNTYYGKAAAKLAKGAQSPAQDSPASVPGFDSPGFLRLE